MIPKEQKFAYQVSPNEDSVNRLIHDLHEIEKSLYKARLRHLKQLNKRKRKMHDTVEAACHDAFQCYDRSYHM